MPVVYYVQVNSRSINEAINIDTSGEMTYDNYAIVYNITDNSYAEQGECI